jgi:lipopolysaccharide biosynthesis protein
MVDLLFVIGMHRSGTSAFAGSAMLLGGAAPLQMPGKSPFNPKGYFEPTVVVLANDRCLAAQERRWSDCRPADVMDAGTASFWVQAFADGLKQAFGPMPLKIVKDPRLSLVVPLWHKAALQIGHLPGYVILLRDPRQSASSILRRDGFSDEAAVALWLRYMLDAERDTRGLPRVILPTAEFSADPAEALARVASVLGVCWPHAPETLPPDFVEPGMIHPAQPVETDLMPLADEAFRALLHLAHQPEDARALARLDAIRASFDPQTQAIHDRFLADRHHKAISQTPLSAALCQSEAEGHPDFPCPKAPLAAERVQRAISDRLRQNAVERLDLVTDAVTHAMRHPLWPLLGYLRFHGLMGLAALVRPVLRPLANWLQRVAGPADPDRFAKGLGALPRRRVRGSRDRILRLPFSTLNEGFVPYHPPAPIDPAVKLIAFYLPQFHPFAENDAWWGKGFTEWSNVGKAVPNFDGHYQPHCPIHLGYYDLRLPSVMEEQARVAKQYGIGGFCYYFYWFGGKILMQEPLEAMLANPAVDMPFCFTWANENWTRRWDGAEHEVLIAQRHSLADSLALLRHLSRYFNDPRYIRIEGKPVFIVYRADLIPDIAETVAAWRDEAEKLGFPGIYLMAAHSFQFGDPTGMGFDAAVEFPPHGVAVTDILAKQSNVRPDFHGHVFDYEQAADHAVSRADVPYKLFRTAMLSWDNTARKQQGANTFHNFGVIAFSQWLSALGHRVMVSPAHGPDEKLVFVNAWNEWAEGSHLEPDRKHGFGYLAAARAALAPFDRASLPPVPVLPAVARAPFAVILHLHYPDLWPEIRESLAGLGPHDLYVSVTDPHAVALVQADRPEAFVEWVENRGRDIRPFLSLLRRIRPLGYRAICKLHSKKSPHLAGGEAKRRSLMSRLVDPALGVALAEDPRLGLIVIQSSLVKRTATNAKWNKDSVAALAKEIGVPLNWAHFPAGSMYWFRPEALIDLDKIDLHRDWGIEKGLTDGTKAHGVERIISFLTARAGFGIRKI